MLRVLACSQERPVYGSQRVFGRFLIKLMCSLKHFYKFHFAHTPFVCEGGGTAIVIPISKVNPNLWIPHPMLYSKH